MQVTPSQAGYSQSLFDMSGVKQDMNQTAQKSKAALQADETVKRVKEIGLRQWAEEENQRKIDEMREKILQSMGLTEADLQGMSADRRASIERMIQDEIQQKLAATAEMNGSKSDKTGNSLGTATEALNANAIAGRLGLGLLDQSTGLLAQEKGLLALNESGLFAARRGAWENNSAPTGRPGDES